MNYLVVLIVDNIDDCPKILSAWEEAGALGITILESTGLGRMRRAGLSEDLPLMPSMHDLYQFGEVHHRTLFSVVDSQEMVDKMVTAVEQVIGDLDDPHTGFLFVVPVSQTHGFGRHRIDRSKE
jgi:nitrogen regulatory protein P-II 1